MSEKKVECNQKKSMQSEPSPISIVKADKVVVGLNPNTQDSYRPYDSLKGRYIKLSYAQD